MQIHTHTHTTHGHKSKRAIIYSVAKRRERKLERTLTAATIRKRRVIDIVKKVL